MGSRLVSRRNVLAAVAAGGGCAAIDALVVEPNWLELTKHDVGVAGLPRHLDGFAIAHVTDAHLTGLGRVETTIARAIRDENVQLVALTGDIIDGAYGAPILEEFCEALSGDGRTVVATLGNWEHWSGLQLNELRSIYSNIGVQLLVNEFRVLAEGVQLCATDDDTAGAVRLEPALAKAGADARLLLTHSPGFLDSVPSQAGRFAVAMAGHTHGGQIRLGAKGVPFVPRGSGRFTSGWYDLPMGPLYVSRGTGTSIVPARFTCRPELPIYRLRQG